jgi:transposase
MSDATTNPTDLKPVTIDLAQLPDDPAFLKQLVVEMAAALKDRDARIASLRHHLTVALRNRYGRKAETIDPKQMDLFLQQIEERFRAMPAPPPPPPAPETPPAGHGRRKPSKSLPRIQEKFPLPEAMKTCATCGKPLVKIGEEVRCLIDYVPASILIREQVQEAWACKPCQGNVVTSELPPTPIEKGMAGAGLLAHVVTSKFADHLPLYRQEAILARHGLEIRRSTLCDWVGRVAELLRPLTEAMRQDVLKSKVIHTDDTPVPVLDERIPAGTPEDAAEAKADDVPGRRKTREGRLWTYVGDPEHPHTVFDFTPTRERAGPEAFLKDWSGKLQADAYGGYDAMYKVEHIVEVACWAHARRYFYDAKGTDPPRAQTALAYIHQLYEVERAAKEMTSPERARLRQERAGPVLEAIKCWMDAQAVLVLPKSPMGEAVGYVLRQWAALVRYVEDGDLDIDNNEAERALRCVAIGRKNWLFAGSNEGGRRAAILYSLVASCKRHRIDPFAYLRDVIDRVATHPVSRIAELLPATWKPAVQP